MPNWGQENPGSGNADGHPNADDQDKSFIPKVIPHLTEFGTQTAIAGVRVLTPREKKEPPFAVHVTRMAGGFTLIAGVVMLIAAAPTLGVAIILLSALYFALAEIINYLAIIAGNSGASRPSHDREELEDFDPELAQR